jgi:molybdopterin synthase catalytic subunit
MSDQRERTIRVLQAQRSNLESQLTSLTEENERYKDALRAIATHRSGKVAPTSPIAIARYALSPIDPPLAQGEGQ